MARPRFNETDRTILALLSQLFDRARLGEVLLIVKPQTVVGWHRRLVARHWTEPARRGHPPPERDVRRLAVRIWDGI